MAIAKDAAGPNIVVLRQGVDLIRRLEDRMYSEDPARPSAADVGMQFRHCLDFYFCLLDGMESGRVDYECRGRDDRIAGDRQYALSRIEILIGRLSELSDRDGARSVRTRGEAPAGSSHESAPWADSSVLRELQFLVSHTVHHYAIIRLMLAARGFEAGRTFGVAPSTLRHWEQQAGHPAV